MYKNLGSLFLSLLISSPVLASNNNAGDEVVKQKSSASNSDIAGDNSEDKQAQKRARLEALKKWASSRFIEIKTIEPKVSMQEHDALRQEHAKSLAELDVTKAELDATKAELEKVHNEKELISKSLALNSKVISELRGTIETLQKQLKFSRDLNQSGQNKRARTDEDQGDVQDEGK